MSDVIICDLDHDNIEAEKAELEKAGVSYEWVDCKTQDDVIEKCKGAKVLLNQYIRMDEKIFSNLPSVGCVVRYGVGYDNINLDDATKYGVTACNIPDYGTCEVADQALAHMMTIVRKVSYSTNLIKNGVWNYQKNIPMYRLGERTIGVCGVGRIGTEFAKRAAALGAHIIGYDVEYQKSGRVFPDFVEFVSFEELLSRSDIISIHCVLDKSTYHMFGEKELFAMKKGAYIVNVARGGIIDEDALCHALESGHLAGAGIDVVEHEPLEADNPLLKCENFTISPHTAWYSEQSALELKRKCALEAIRFLSGEGVHYKVNK